MKAYRHNVAAVCFAALAVFYHGGDACGETPLRMVYFERPPYYYTHRGEARGVLVETTRAIIAEADLSAVFEKMPVKRIINEIQSAKSPVCSIGWFKNEERSAFASFTLPIYQDLPMVVLTTREKQPRFSEYPALDTLLADRSQTLGVISGFSFGMAVDRRIAHRNPPHITITGNQSQLLKMLAAGRIDYIITAPEGIHGALQAAGLQPDDFSTVAFSDIPPGNQRYLMCSAAVPETVIDRINKAILRIRYHRSTHTIPEPVWDTPPDYHP